MTASAVHCTDASGAGYAPHGRAVVQLLPFTSLDGLSVADRKIRHFKLVRFGTGINPEENLSEHTCWKKVVPFGL